MYLLKGEREIFNCQLAWRRHKSKSTVLCFEKHEKLNRNIVLSLPLTLAHSPSSLSHDIVIESYWNSEFLLCKWHHHDSIDWLLMSSSFSPILFLWIYSGLLWIITRLCWLRFWTLALWILSFRWSISLLLVISYNSPTVRDNKKKTIHKSMAKQQSNNER